LEEAVKERDKMHDAIVIWHWWRFALMTCEDGTRTYWLAIRLREGNR